MRSLAGSRQALAGLAERERLDPRQKLLRHEVRRVWRSRSPSAPKAGCTSKPARPPGQACRARQRRIAVGDEDHAREVAADERLERGAQLGEIAGQIAVEHLLRILDRRRSCRRFSNSVRSVAGFDDDVGDQAGEIDVVRADGEQHEVELAIRRAGGAPAP